LIDYLSERASERASDRSLSTTAIMVGFMMLSTCTGCSILIMSVHLLLSKQTVGYMPMWWCAD